MALVQHCSAATFPLDSARPWPNAGSTCPAFPAMTHGPVDGMEGVRGSNPLSSTEFKTQAPDTHIVRGLCHELDQAERFEEEGDEGARRSPLSSTYFCRSEA